MPRIRQYEEKYAREDFCKAIAHAQVDAGVRTAKELAQLQKKVAQANRKIESMIEHAQRTPKDDVDKLLEQVSRTVDSVMRYADQIGATVVCEYETYFIDGRYVEIDPLRVVNV